MTNFSKLVVETAVIILKPAIPVASRKSDARIVINCGNEGKPTNKNVVKSSGDMYIIPLKPPASNLPEASSKRVTGRLSR